MNSVTKKHTKQLAHGTNSDRVHTPWAFFISPVGSCKREHESYGSRQSAGKAVKHPSQGKAHMRLLVRFQPGVFIITGAPLYSDKPMPRGGRNATASMRLINQGETPMPPPFLTSQGLLPYSLSVRPVGGVHTHSSAAEQAPSKGCTRVRLPVGDFYIRPGNQ